MLEFNDSEILRAGAVSGMFQFAFFGLVCGGIYLFMGLTRMSQGTDLPLDDYLADRRTLPVAYHFLEGMVRLHHDAAFEAVRLENRLQV